MRDCVSGDGSGYSRRVVAQIVAPSAIGSECFITTQQQHLLFQDLLFVLSSVTASSSLLLSDIFYSLLSSPTTIRYSSFLDSSSSCWESHSTALPSEHAQSVQFVVSWEEAVTHTRHTTLESDEEGDNKRCSSSSSSTGIVLCLFLIVLCLRTAYCCAVHGKLSYRPPDPFSLTRSLSFFLSFSLSLISTNRSTIDSLMCTEREAENRKKKRGAR